LLCNFSHNQKKKENRVGMGNSTQKTFTGSINNNSSGHSRWSVDGGEGMNALTFASKMKNNFPQ